MALCVYANHRVGEKLTRLAFSVGVLQQWCGSSVNISVPYLVQLLRKFGAWGDWWREIPPFSLSVGERTLMKYFDLALPLLFFFRVKEF